MTFENYFTISAFFVEFITKWLSGIFKIIFIKWQFG
jgi:hypothetical protein